MMLIPPLPDGTKLVLYNIQSELLATDLQLKNDVGITDLVGFPGYPEWFDRNGSRPIMRTGTIASDPESDYQAEKQPPARRIGYEAFSFGGSSGSPVFALEKGLQVGHGLQGGYYRPLLLIGINAGHLLSTDDAEHQHSGISFMFKAQVISELIAASVE